MPLFVVHVHQRDMRGLSRRRLLRPLGL